MKKYYPLTLIALSAILLTGCDKKIGEDTYKEKLHAAEDYIANNGGEIKNINIHNKNNHDVYNYKEGEFYCHYERAILTYTGQEYVWKEGDKYYRYHNGWFQSETCVEITKDDFDAKLAAGKLEVLAELNKPLLRAEQLMNENQEEFKSVSNKFYQPTFKKQLVLESAVTYDYTENEETKEGKGTFTISIKDNLPLSYVSKDFEGSYSNTTWSYTLNKANTEIPENIRNKMPA